MQPSPNIFKDMKLLTSLIYFTRLPFWRLKQVPAESFKRVVDCWTFVGWLTGGAMALALGLAAMFVSMDVAVLLALLTRLLLTGAFHEDGLADFCDGFGGGTSREQTLRIMKDSHIGTYGVLGLIVYYLLLWQALEGLPVEVACLALLGGDAWSKFCASQIINLLPYARKEEEAKAKVVYNRMSPAAWALSFVGVFIPLHWWGTAVVPLGVSLLMIGWMKRRLGGYTGDCCGATFLLSELSFYLAIHVAFNCLL
jgi:adenosylcobinamide-GDP ribazoletransferase